MLNAKRLQATGNTKAANSHISLDLVLVYSEDDVIGIAGPTECELREEFILANLLCSQTMSLAEGGTNHHRGVSRAFSFNHVSISRRSKLIEDLEE